MLKTLKTGDEFGPAAEETRKKVVDYMDKEAKRLVERGQNISELNEHNSTVKLRNTPSVAALYTVMQNQKQNYFSINADASEEGLEKVMRYVHNKTIAKENKKVVLNRTGGRILHNPRKRILSVSKRLQNVDIHYGDAWELIYEIAGKGDFVLVDPSYLGKITENYNKSTREDSDPDIYMNKVKKYILPAFDRGAKFLVTNNWNDKIVGDFLKLGFTVFKAERAKEQSKGKPELVAINFDPFTGALNPIVRPHDIDSYAGIKKAA
ncbi:MAG: DNA adenine methylase [Deltaproteobacteria bacterium]|nr:DNA adenine methylase [Deltaproteobacteria bacterium]